MYHEGSIVRQRDSDLLLLCVCVCCHQDATRRQRSFFLLPLAGKCAPATQQACPGLWFWNVGELPPQRPAVGGRCWWARPSPQTWLVHTLCVCPGNQASTLHAASMGAERLNRCPEPSCFPCKQKCLWPRGRKDSDSSRHLWLPGGHDCLKLLWDPLPPRRGHILMACPRLV